MHEPIDHPLSPSATVEDIVLVLRAMQAEALAAARQAALTTVLHETTSHLKDAMFFGGQARLLGSLLWALDGTADADGCTPTVHVGH